MTERRLTEVAEWLTNPGLIAVVRARRKDQVIPLGEALVEGGILAIEITLTTPRAVQAVREARQHFGHRAVVGVGTVLDVRAAQETLAAGAEFVVTPILRPEIVDVAHRAGRPVMLGAYTPTEAQRVFEAGADFVKLFPAGVLGPNYIKAIRAPLPHLKIVPTGGVNLDTIEPFLTAGCVALGVGSSLIRRDILEGDDWAALARLAREYVERVAEVRQGLKGG